MLDKNKLLEEFLYDDGCDRDVVTFANRIGVGVYRNVELEGAFFAKHSELGNCIGYNPKCSKNTKDHVFLVSYLLSKYILSKDKLDFYLFSLEDIDFDVYNLAKKIYEREFLYKSKSFKDTAGYQRQR